MSRPLAIFGAGGQARETLQLVRDINGASPAWDVLGFLVDEGYLGQGTVHGLPVHGALPWLSAHPEVSLVVAVGSSSARYGIVERLSSRAPNSFATLVHPSAWLGDGVEIGHGSLVCAGALLTTDIRVGRHVHVNLACTVGHDAEIRDYATLNQRVSVAGNARVGTGCELGTASCALPGVELGDWTILGAGTVATEDLPANVTAVGAPARIVKNRPPGWHSPHPGEPW